MNFVATRLAASMYNMLETELQMPWMSFEIVNFIIRTNVRGEWKSNVTAVAKKNVGSGGYGEAPSTSYATVRDFAINGALKQKSNPMHALRWDLQSASFRTFTWSRSSTKTTLSYFAGPGRLAPVLVNRILHKFANDISKG